MARRKKRIKKNILALFIIIILLGCTFLFLKNSDLFKTKDTPDSNPINNIIKPKEPTDEIYKTNLLATGDGLIHNIVAGYAKTSDGYDFRPYLTEIKDIASKYDIVYYNQETPFGENGVYTFYPTFSVPSEYGDAMVDAGFNLVSLASNHSFDKGESGVLRSLKFWKTKDIMYDGISDSIEERNNFQIGEKNNITYAMISYTYGLNGFKLPNGKDYLVNVFSYEQAQKDIEYLRDKVDVLIVAMHWGVEYSFDPTNEQKEQAKWLANHNVDIVIGNHSHCIEPVEWIDNTLVIYSLGNFISNQGILKGGNYVYQGTVKGSIGAMAMLDITKTVHPDKTQELKLDNLKIDLLYTYRNSKQKYFKVLPFSKMNDTYMANYPTSNDDTWYIGDYKKVYDMYSNIIKKYDNTIEVVELPVN